MVIIISAVYGISDNSRVNLQESKNIVVTLTTLQFIILISHLQDNQETWVENGVWVALTQKKTERIMFNW